jgi:uncharacterized protein (TIGR00369 family)
MVQKTRRSPEEQEHLHAQVTELWEDWISFNKVLGFKVHSLNPQDARVRFAMKPELVGHYAYGRLHGGVISSVLDASGGYALMLALAERHCEEASDQILHRFLRMGTIDLRVDYLHQGIGTVFEARAKVTRLGGRIGSTQMALYNEQELLIATAAAAYVVS